MFRKKDEKPKPVRLHKVEEPTPTTMEKAIVFIGIILGFILLLLLFLLICYIIVPKTYGFFWW